MIPSTLAPGWDSLASFGGHGVRGERCFDDGWLMRGAVWYIYWYVCALCGRPLFIS